MDLRIANNCILPVADTETDVLDLIRERHQ